MQKKMNLGMSVQGFGFYQNYVDFVSMETYSYWALSVISIYLKFCYH